MAAAFFNEYADPSKALAVAAGTHPAECVHPEVVEVMCEIGINLTAAKPQKLSPELIKNASLLITLGCGDECPFVPGLNREDWPLTDPRGLRTEQVRKIRDEIEKRAKDLIKSERVGF